MAMYICQDTLQVRQVLVIIVWTRGKMPIYKKEKKKKSNVLL